MKKLLSLLLVACVLLSSSVVSFGATNAMVEDILVNKSKLSTAISTGTSYYMSLDNFTTGSWGTLLWELEDANRVNHDKEATQAEVYLATQELNDAIDCLKRVGEPAKTLFVNVDDVKTGEETFWAYIWNDRMDSRWEEAKRTDTGRLTIGVNYGEGVVFTRIKKGEQADWLNVLNQTDDAVYTGEYDCAVLTYVDTYHGMALEWKKSDESSKNNLLKAMFKAEEYLYNETDVYTAESITALKNAYIDIQHVYVTATTDDECDLARQKLMDAIACFQKANNLIGDIAGDVDIDGVVSIMDATVIQRHLANISQIDAKNIARADIDKDGNITVMDATEIQLFLAHIDGVLM